MNMRKYEDVYEGDPSAFNYFCVVCEAQQR